MRTEDKKRFSDLMLGMADNFRDTISKEGMSMRWELLKEFSIEQVESACLKIIKIRKFTKMPPMAEFLEAINPPKQIGFSAHTEADKILQHLRMFGSIKSPELNDPITKHLMTKRWPYTAWARTVLESELKWWHKEFVNAYENYSNSDMPLQIDFPEGLKEITSGMFDDV